MSWINFLEKMSSECPTKTALIEQRAGRYLSYHSLNEEVKRWVCYLTKKGARKGERVALLGLNSIEHITILLACAKIGCIFVPLNFRLSQKELQEIVDRIEPLLLFTRSKTCLSSQALFIDLNSFELPNEMSEHSETMNPNDPVLMLFTSGTTGSPKGVLLHGQMLEANQRETCRSWGLVENDRCLVETPFFHTGGYNVLALPLLSIGGSVVLAEKFDLDNVYESLKKEKISVYFAVPTMFQLIREDRRFEDFSFSELRFLISGGAHCSEELILSYQKKGLTFKQGFGLTEVGPNCFLLDDADAVNKVGSIGVPMPHSEVLIIKDDGAVALIGEIGELLIRGPHLCSGYYKEEKRFESSLFDGHFKTGDLAMRDRDGFYFIVGRKKEMYISGGENVYPAEVENKIRKVSEVLDAVVVSVDDEKWGEVGMAFVKSTCEISIEGLRGHLNEELSRYKHPHYIQRVETFPLLDSGKVNRSELKKQAQNFLFQNNGEA